MLTETKCSQDNCPIVTFSDLTPAEQRVQRARKAREMSERGFTEEQIAKQFDVSKSTISTDLANFPETGKLKSAKTASNPKGAGRPRGSTKPRKGKKNDAAAAKTAARLVLDQGLTHEKAGQQTKAGSELLVRVAVAREEGSREVLTWLGLNSIDSIDSKTLSLSAQKKLEIAVRVIERKLNAEHAARIQKLDEEVRQRVLREGKEYLATLQEMRDKAEANEKLYRELINDHKTPFTIDQFKTILMCLHPDGERTAAKLNAAFLLFNGKKTQLTGEK